MAWIKKTDLTPAILLGILLAGGCATGGRNEGGAVPSIVYARTQPATIELNRSFQPTRTAEVLADINDSGKNVTEVKLEFTDVPLEIPMEHIGGSTWRAQLSPRQLEMLAVSGQTMRYGANVIARNSDGRAAVTHKPIEVAIKAPEMSTTGSG
jgi:hypothetical protein